LDWDAEQWNDVKSEKAFFPLLVVALLFQQPGFLPPALQLASLYFVSPKHSVLLKRVKATLSSQWEFWETHDRATERHLP